MAGCWKSCLLLIWPFIPVCHMGWGPGVDVMRLLSFFTLLSELESLTNPRSQWFSQAGWLVSPIYLAIASASLCRWKNDTMYGLSHCLLRMTIEWNSGTWVETFLGIRTVKFMFKGGYTRFPPLDLTVLAPLPLLLVLPCFFQAECGLL